MNTLTKLYCIICTKPFLRKRGKSSVRNLKVKYPTRGKNCSTCSKKCSALLRFKMNGGLNDAI